MIERQPGPTHRHRCHRHVPLQRALRPPVVPPGGVGQTATPPPPPSNRSRVVDRARAARADPRPQRQRRSSTTSPSTSSPSTGSTRRCTPCRAAQLVVAARPAARRHRRRAREANRRPARLHRSHRCASPTGIPPEVADVHRGARGPIPGRRRSQRPPCARLPERARSPPTSRLRRRDQRRRAQGPSRSEGYRRRRPRSARTASSRPSRTSCAARPREARGRGRQPGSGRARRSRTRRPWPATTSSSRSTSTSSAWPSSRSPGHGRRARDPRPEREAAPRELPGRRRSRGRARPERRIGRRDGVEPDLRPTPVRRRHHARGVPAAQPAESNFPLVNRAVAGSVRAGSTFKPFTAARGVCQTGAARPERRLLRPGCLSIGAERARATPEDPARHRQSARRAHGLERHVLLQRRPRHVAALQRLDQGAEQRHGRRRGRDQQGVRDPEHRQGVRLRPAHRRRTARRGRRSCAGPALEGAVQPERARPASEARAVVWLPGDNVNLAVGQGDLLVTPLQLATRTPRSPTAARSSRRGSRACVLEPRHRPRPAASGDRDLPPQPVAHDRAVARESPT